MTSRSRTAGSAVASILATLLLAACSASGGGAAATTAPSAAASSAPSASAAAGSGCPTSQPAALPAGETRTVTITTDKGAIAISVDADLSPIAAGNFVALADCGFYDGVVFHRLVPGFVIQGGDGQFGRIDARPDLVGTGGPGYTIKDEPVTTPYRRGTVAMARIQRPGHGRLAVLHRARRRRRASLGCRVQQLPDHRQRELRHGHRRRDRRGCRTAAASERSGRPVAMDVGHRLHPVTAKEQP